MRERALCDEARREATHGPAHLRLIPAIDPVVVLLGERPGRARRREHLREARQISRPAREPLACRTRDLVGVRAESREPLIGTLAVPGKTLRDGADDQ